MADSKAEKKQYQFKIKTPDQLQSLIDQYAPSLRLSDDFSPLHKPVQIGSFTTPNAIAIHPMEGCDAQAHGKPSELTRRRYQRFAAGGAGLIWVEASAVVPQGRANPRQLIINQENLEDFKLLVKLIHQHARDAMGEKHRPLLVLQLTHSGRYANPQGAPAPIIPQHDPYRDPLSPEQIPSTDRPSRLPQSLKPITDAQLDELQAAYVNAADLAYQAGFDIVDIKACHGYLINELLASRNRTGKYGGSFENRTRFLLEIIDKIKNQLNVPAHRIATRLGFYDAIPYPFGWAVDQEDYRKADLTEPFKLVDLLEKKGVKLINLTIGNPYYNPHIGRPYDKPIDEGYHEPEHPLQGIERLVNIAAQVQEKFPNIVIIGTGYSWFRHLLPYPAAANLASGKIKMVGLGRMGFAYPDFPKDILTKQQSLLKKACTACSGCTQLMRDKQVSGCIVRDAKLYAPIYKAARKKYKASTDEKKTTLLF